MPVKVTAVDATPLHNVWLAGVATVGDGLTVTVKLCAVPTHVLAVGVTVIVPAIAEEVPLVAVKEEIFPEPEFVRPIAVLLFVHAYVVPATAPVKFKAPVAFPLHTARLAGTVTVGVGFTVIVKFCGLPTQPFAVGVTVIVAVDAEELALVAVNDGMLPEPDAPRLMPVLLLIHA